MTHALHPDMHIHGLADGCEDCYHYSLNPFLMDNKMIAELYDMALHHHFGRSANESNALVIMKDMIQKLRRVKLTTEEANVECLNCGWVGKMYGDFVYRSNRY